MVPRNDRELGTVFEAADLLLCPTTPGRAHNHDGPGEHLSVALTWAFNLSGHPAVSVPAGFTRDGVPVGLQIIARPGSDNALMGLLERHVPTAPIATAPCRHATGTAPSAPPPGHPLRVMPRPAPGTTVTVAARRRP
ncbi:MAG: hypothetical protein L0I76_16365 [Pseudonocardia sp.]|nr:hypothetical protein [Pseudonocardia sp.]